MTTWTKTPPTEPGDWKWRPDAHSEPFSGQVSICTGKLRFLNWCGTPFVKGLGGEWLRLIPADESSERGVAAAFEAVAVEIEKFEAERKKWRAEVEKAYHEGSSDAGGGKLRDWERSNAHSVATGQEEPTS